MAQCKVHPESPLPGSPRGWHFGPWTIPGPRCSESSRVPPRSWEPPAQSAAAPCSEPSDPDCPPPQPEPGLPPCTPAPRLPGGQDRRPASAQLSGCSRGCGREAPKRLRNPLSGPAWGASSMEKLVSVEEAERKTRSSS